MIVELPAIYARDVCARLPKLAVEQYGGRRMVFVEVEDLEALKHDAWAVSTYAVRNNLQASATSAYLRLMLSESAA